jgi:hypothetical protein
VNIEATETMQQKPRLSAATKGGRPSRRRREAEIPAVPTFEAPLKISPPPSEPEDDQADEAVRRMVEAAYT